MVIFASMMCLLLLSQNSAPDKPDFSGHWVLDAAAASADVPRALQVTQLITRTTIRGDPMAPVFSEIRIERQTPSGTTSDRHQIGVEGGVVGGVVPADEAAHTPPAPEMRFSTKWEGQTLVLCVGTYAGPQATSTKWTERREEWSLQSDGRLRVTVTTHASGADPQTTTTRYRRE